MNGLTEILAALYSEGRQADKGASEEIMKRLEETKNHIPSSRVVRREYAHLLGEEYKRYVADRKRAARGE